MPDLNPTTRQLLRDIAALLPCAAYRLHPDDIFNLQTRICEALAVPAPFPEPAPTSIPLPPQFPNCDMLQAAAWCDRNKARLTMVWRGGKLHLIAVPDTFLPDVPPRQAE